MSDGSHTLQEPSPKRRRFFTEASPDAKDIIKMSSGEVTHEDTIPIIELNALEATLKQLLLDVAQFIDSSRETTSGQSLRDASERLAESPTVLRFTGGWVRDKLLGVDSQDIDVAINNMTGLEFGLKMREYLAIAGNEEKYGIGKKNEASPDAVTKDGSERGISLGAEAVKGLGGLHKIEKNPEKSKHLETVATRVLGLDIDLVNLRTETYSEDSRNPQMQFGTPEEDALRRDATVNALFYNLNTSSVEDFTGRGLDDMRMKIIRTPLEPRQTFMDDPLRVLRLIRFAGRLGYKIDAGTEKAMDRGDIRAALNTKISRERVGAEVEKMLKGNAPLTALALIHRLNLYSTIFPAPPEAKELAPVMESWNRAYEYVDDMIKISRLPVEGIQGSGILDKWTVASMLLPDSQSVYNAWLLACMVPWSKAPRLPPPKRGAPTPPPIPALVAREGIRAPNKQFAVISHAFKNAEEISSLQRTIASESTESTPSAKGSSSSPTGRDVLGMAMRKWGETWRSQVLLALLLDIVHSNEHQATTGVEPITSGYATFLRHLKNLDLLDAHSVVPIINGKKLAGALQAKTGPWMKEALELVVAWQFRNPGVTDPEEAIQEVEKHRDRLQIQ